MSSRSGCTLPPKEAQEKKEATIKCYGQVLAAFKGQVEACVAQNISGFHFPTFKFLLVFIQHSIKFYNFSTVQLITGYHTRNHI